MRKLVLVLVAAVAAAGCTHVAPYERGYLARPGMALDPGQGVAHAMDKIYPSKEAASGGASVGGGGCGCN